MDGSEIRFAVVVPGLLLLRRMNTRQRTGESWGKVLEHCGYNRTRRDCTIRVAIQLGRKYGVNISTEGLLVKSILRKNSSSSYQGTRGDTLRHVVYS